MLTTSFDLAADQPSPLPRVGVEYFPGSRAANLPRWRELAGALAERGLSTPEKSTALLAWPGYTVPERHDAACRFSVIGRRLSHVKITCGSGVGLRAKAYFGFGPLWLRPDSSESDRRVGSSPVPAAATGHQGAPPQSVRRCMARAVDYLLAARGGEGWWRDFPTVMGGSDEWVTAYVATELARIGDASVDHAGARLAALAAWQWMQGRRVEDRGWGFNRELPEDADATAWGLLLAWALGVQDGARARAALGVLRSHVSPDGGVASYAPRAAGGLSAALGRDTALDGLFAAHVCVSAATAHLPPLTDAVSGFLCDRQLDDGRWLGYWWCDDEYATGLAAGGLGSRSDTRARRASRRALAWIIDRIREDGSVISRYSGDASAFAAASGVPALLGAGLAGVSGRLAAECGRAARRAVNRLLETQAEDGSWAPAAWMRIPPADSVAPSGDGFGSFIGVDRAGIFTTATVLRALRAFAAAGL